MVNNMKFIVAIVFVVVAAASAVQQGPKWTQTPSSKKTFSELTQTLEKIRANLQSMKPSIIAAAGLVDSIATKKLVDTPETVNNAYLRLNEMNIPEDCLQAATTKLDVIKRAVVPNCSALHIVEDVGTISYSSANFLSLSMLYVDEFLNGLVPCQPWYNPFHSIPCFISYVITNYRDVSGLISKAVVAYTDISGSTFDIAKQILCKQTQLSSLQYTAPQVVNEAYLCAKNSVN